MLMFDNSIFASFIPQVLMVLGYILCMLLPGVDKSLPQPKADIVSYQVEYTPKADTKSIYVVSHSEIAPVVVVEPLTETQPPVEQSIKTFFSHCFFYTGDKVSFSLFSRPPPSFC